MLDQQNEQWQLVLSECVLPITPVARSAPPMRDSGFVTGLCAGVAGMCCYGMWCWHLAGAWRLWGYVWSCQTCQMHAGPLPVPVWGFDQLGQLRCSPAGCDHFCELLVADYSGIPSPLTRAVVECACSTSCCGGAPYWRRQCYC